jgi:hypothetical protein
MPAISRRVGETTHWTGRMLAKAAGVSLQSVQRILEAHQLAPHHIRTFFWLIRRRISDFR